MANVNLSLAVVVALFSGLLILGGVQVYGECGDDCTVESYIMCANKTRGEQFGGCDCDCLPMFGESCAVYFLNGTVIQCED
ncbi:hypothetical protein ACP4OV_026271 [Aristida adscensionis]